MDLVLREQRREVLVEVRQVAVPHGEGQLSEAGLLRLLLLLLRGHGEEGDELRGAKARGSL